jgi:hypothetical protein
MVPDQPGREPQHGVPVDLEVVVPVHVVPVLLGIHVLAAVDLHDDPGVLPDGVQVAPFPGGVLADALPIGFGEVMRTDYQPGEVQFGQRLGPARDVAERLGHELAPVQPLVSGNDTAQVAGPDQSLLNACSQDGPGAPIGGHPRGGVHQ